MKSTSLWFLLGLTIQTLSAQTSSPKFLSHPVLSPDAKTVVFSFEGDLWKAATTDLQATRLTAMQGYETTPRISPDGQWLAFTGEQMGNTDIYIMPLAGGEIKQLTFHSAADQLSNFSWDSKTIYFTSNRYGPVSAYTVSINGGTPKRLFGDHYFLMDHLVAEHPISGDLYFNDTWESNNQVARKRYKGPFNPDIQSYNPKTKQYQKHTNWEGKDFASTIDQKGNLYFISDEANGEYNLYTIQNGKKTALTQFTTSIKTPVVSASGAYIVFEKDYQIWWYNVASKTASPLNIQLYRNQVLPAQKEYDVRGKITAMDVSPDGKKLAFISRGELFVSDVEGKFIKQINKGNTERAKEVKWLADNQTLLFNETVNGYLNLFSVAADGNSAPKQLTNQSKDNRALVLNKSKSKMVYLSGRDEVVLMDTKTFETNTLVKDEIWAMQNSSPGFSPNEAYVVFTVIRNFEQDILIHDIKQQKTFNLTNTGVSEADPIWSPDGKYIYFVSNRTKPSYPFGMSEPRIFRMALEKLDEPYRSDKFNELFKVEKKDSSKATVANNAITIDFNGLMERLEQVGPRFGSQYLLNVLKKGDKTTVLYISDHAEGRNALWKTVLDPFEPAKTERINGIEANGIDFAESNDKQFLLGGGNIYKLSLDANKADQLNISQTFQRNLSNEFKQIFQETWAQVEQNFYDETFHGVDWLAMKKKYEGYLPAINTRADLRVLLNDLLGELNSSHQGFSSTGEEETIRLVNRTMETGILFENDQPLTVKTIVANSAVDKKGIQINPGDVLVKVNDELVDPTKDRNSYFSKPSFDRELQLQFNRKGQLYTVNIHPQRTIAPNLYGEWFKQNQQSVDAKTKQRVAYHHMKDMGLGELEQFLIDMTQDLYQKDGLILDLRYNTGGNVHDEVLKFLSQKTYLRWKYREGKLTPQSNFGPSDKPIVLLINEQSLSDAEMTASGFKALKLGKIIGMPTYRWIIFTSGTGMVDGSFVRLPSWGCYSMDGKDLEFTGVAPDILVPLNFQDKINKRDPQLDKAIEEVLKQLK